MAPARVPTATTALTSAPYAETPNTALKPAPNDPRRITTPLRPQAWESKLHELGLLSDFGDVPPGLTYGFRIGATRSLITSSFPPNHRSALDRPDIIRNAIAKEVSAGRYSGPFTAAQLESSIGPFRSAPLGVVEKSTPGEYRIIQDFSFPRDGGSHPALNDEIDPNAYPCEWGYFHLVANFIATAPALTQGATFDVDAAYRRMPVHPHDQPHIIVHWENQFWVDHCVPFGAASSNGIFARCGDAITHIYERLGMGPVFKWVDDFLFFRLPSPGPTPSFNYSEPDIELLADSLGWPWKLSKKRPFAPSFVYLGFDWSIPLRQVSIPLAKREKYARRIRSLCDGHSPSLQEVEQVVGSLMHCSQVVRGGRPYLAGLINFGAHFDRGHSYQFQRRHLSKRARADADWWLCELTNGSCTRQLRPPLPPHSVPCYMDASTSSGIGIIIGVHFAAWKLQAGWKKPGVDIGWAEMIAVELALSALVGLQVHGRSVQFYSDNMGVVYALQAGRSRNEHQNAALARILELADTHVIELSVSYIASLQNPADAPSRGIAPTGLCPIDWPFDIPAPIAPYLIKLDL